MSTDWSANFASAGLDAMTAYDEILVPRLFDPWAEVLLDEVGVVPGASVLDVACGPGTVARRAAGRCRNRAVSCERADKTVQLAVQHRPNRP